MQVLRSGHRLLLESCASVAVVAVQLTGFRELCAAMPMPVVVEKWNAVLAAVDSTLRMAGLEMLDVVGDTYFAFHAFSCAFAPVLSACCMSCAPGVAHVHTLRGSAQSAQSAQSAAGVCRWVVSRSGTYSCLFLIKSLRCNAADVCRYEGEVAAGLQRAARAAIAAVTHHPAGAQLRLSQRLHVRAAMHCGPAVGAVLGVQRPKYGLFGAAMDVTAQLLQLAAPQSLLLSPDVAAHVQVCPL